MPVANGITTPFALRVASPWIGYVTKLGLSCSPSVMTGDPVASSSDDRLLERLLEQCGQFIPGRSSLGDAAHALDQLGWPGMRFRSARSGSTRPHARG